MRDLLVLAVVGGFFALCVAYVALCDRILGPDPAAPADADGGLEGAAGADVADPAASPTDRAASPTDRAACPTGVSA